MPKDMGIDTYIPIVGNLGVGEVLNAGVGETINIGLVLI